MDAAVELFNEVGYFNTGLGDVVDRAGLTKGALYHHFSSKEALAAAIIDEASDILLKNFQATTRSPGPALESMIHGVLVVVELGNTDRLVRMGAVLLRIFAKFSEISTSNYKAWLAEMGTQTRRAQAEGDLRADIDANTAGDFIVSAILGTELISNAVSGGQDLLQRVTQSWELLLAALATEESLPYLQEFLARETLRRSGQSSPLGPQLLG